MRTVIHAALSAGFLCACAEPGADPKVFDEAIVPDVPLTGAARCDEDVFSPLVGESLVVLQTIETPEETRVVPPGSITTTDYLPHRLNIEHGDNEIISKVWCG
ncbi:I78 family peptidase inhibitor [Pseudopelagicola sp. nBUS_20]|uniref:I78 family peptidase inhibitor n=1 Tax=Pseudopelagicola sp. nBUS_20 TaxID=3395317 RepID=UPI003EB77E03